MQMVSSYNKIVTNIKYYPLRTEIGFLLMAVGVQTGTAIRNVIHIEMVNLLMAASVLLTINFKNLYTFKFPTFNIFFAWLWLFQIIELIYTTGYNGSKDIFPYILMHFYLIAITISISTQNKSLSFKHLGKLLFYIPGFISLVVLYQSTMGFTGLYSQDVFFNAEIGTSAMTDGGDKITMGRALLLSIVASIVYKHRNKLELFLRIFFVASSFIGLLMFNTRASILCAFICACAYFFKNIQIRKDTPNFNTTKIYKKLITQISIVAIVAIIAYFCNDYINERLSTWFISIQRGILTYLGDTSMGKDISTIHRYRMFQKLESLLYDGGYPLKNFIFGFGYLPFYIDIPIIQAFYDFGLWGIIYFYILIISPIKFILKKSRIAPVVIIQLFAIQYLFDQLYCGLPYFFFQFMPIILLVYFYTNNKKNFNNGPIPFPSSRRRQKRI